MLSTAHAGLELPFPMGALRTSDRPKFIQGTVRRIAMDDTLRFLPNDILPQPLKELGEWPMENPDEIVYRSTIRAPTTPTSLETRSACRTDRRSLKECAYPLASGRKRLGYACYLWVLAMAEHLRLIRNDNAQACQTAPYSRI